MMNLLLKNATYIDWNTLEISVRNILVRQGMAAIQFIETPVAGTRSSDTEVLDCTGRLVTKSFAVGHHHAYSALSRGMGAPKKSPQNFLEILRYVWWTLDKCLDPAMIESGALVTAMACAKAGSTFVIDHHASPFAVRGSLEIMARAFERVGVSHLLCYEISDRDGILVTKEGLAETDNYLRDHQGLVGLHASFTVNDKTLGKAVEMMQRYRSGIHIHVAEDAYDQGQCLKKHGRRVIERLAKAGALSSSKTILVHCLHLDENEKELIRNSPAWVVQNCESNLNNNVGYFKSTGLGRNIMLGTDGMHSDMLRSAQSAFFVGKGFDDITAESAYHRFRNVHRYLSSNNFTGDEENNLVILDYDSPTPVASENFLGHFLFGMTSGHITDVISGGRLIVRGGKITTVDEEEILRESRKQAERLWSRM